MLLTTSKTKGLWQLDFQCHDGPLEAFNLSLKLKRAWLGKFTGNCQLFGQQATVVGFIEADAIEMKISAPKALFVASNQQYSLKEILNEQGEHYFRDELPLQLSLQGNLTAINQGQGQWRANGLVAAGCCGFNKIPFALGHWSLVKS